MADSKISNLTASTALAATDELVIASGGASKKITAANARKFMPGYELDYVQITATVTITAASDATAASVIDGNAVTYDGSTRVKIEFAAIGCDIAGSNEMVFNLYDGSTDLGRIAAVGNPQAGQGDIPLAAAPVFLTPSAASHTYHIKAWRVVNSGTMRVYAGAGGTATSMPAWYRITVA
jgi:hypothetical protein